jgi:hypothetical protein
LSSYWLLASGSWLLPSILVDSDRVFDQQVQSAGESDEQTVLRRKKDE